MPEAISLKDAERKALRLALYQDGLWDMYVGGLLVMMSFYPILRERLGPVTNLLLLFATLGAVSLVVYLARRHLITPRIGVVNLGRQQKRRIKELHIVTLALVVGTFALYALAAIGGLAEPAWAAGPAWLRDFDVDLLFSALIVGLFALASYVLGVPRLHLYGWLFGVSNFSATVLDVYYGYRFHFPMAIAGVVMMVIGVVLLGRFLHDYSVPTGIEEA